MSERDEFLIDELRDQADDHLLGELDRAELLGLPTPTRRDPFEPAPADLDEWEPIYIRHGRKGQ